MFPFVSRRGTDASTPPAATPDAPAPSSGAAVQSLETSFTVDTLDSRALGATVYRSGAIELPRAQLTGAPSASVASLASFLGAHPTLRAAGAAIMGTLSLAGGLFGAPLQAQAVESPMPVRANADRSIVYVGMNVDARHEVENLRGAVGKAGVTFIEKGAKPDVVNVGDASYDLASPEGRTAFAAKLGLVGDRAAALEQVLLDAGDNGRDELGQLARVFAQAERGERNIERIVFSGHSVGSSVWGDDNGTLAWTTVGALTTIFPRAAGQVQDLLIAACYSGGEDTMDQYRAMFPNVKTIWAYDGSAPGSVSGAVPHILRWERGTRGTSIDNLNRDAAKGTRKGENVAVWTESKGYANGQEPLPLETVMETYTTSKPAVERARTGELVVENPQTGELREHYNHIQRLLGRKDLTPEQRTELKGERDFVIRLLFFKNVSHFFSLTHKSAITAGYQAVGLQAPDFSKLSRADALKAIADFDAKVAELGDAAPRAAKYLSEILNNGIKDLRPSYIPEQWI
ncbi:hypothetical protein L6R52_02395 [Myxococcota bacterium]|nr:hypothetical protein [Myxococcota bacterium]